MPDSIDLVIPAYNASGTIRRTLDVVARQRREDDWKFRVYVYNDGSTDATGSVLQELARQYAFLEVIDGNPNCGRSEARNRGVMAGHGDIVILCDVDCRYTRDDTIAEFVREIQGGADAVIGMVKVEGDGFWSRYTNSVLPERIDSEQDQGLMAYGTTQNVALRRSIFETLGGYGTEYRHYGFEDKDFLIRLERACDKVVVRPDLLVSHDDDLGLDDMCRKFAEAGQYTAPIFRARYPDEYQKLAYRHCDATNGSLRGLGKPLSGIFATAFRAIARSGLALPIGFGAKRALVRLALCAAYFHGSKLAKEPV